MYDISDNTINSRDYYIKLNSNIQLDTEIKKPYSNRNYINKKLWI